MPRERPRGGVSSLLAAEKAAAAAGAGDGSSGGALASSSSSSRFQWSPQGGSQAGVRGARRVVKQGASSGDGVRGGCLDTAPDHEDQGGAAGAEGGSGGEGVSTPPGGQRWSRGGARGGTRFGGVARVLNGVWEDEEGEGASRLSGNRERGDEEEEQEGSEEEEVELELEGEHEEDGYVLEEEEGEEEQWSLRDYGELPDPVWLSVMGGLGVRDLCYVARANKGLRNLAVNTPTLWSALYKVCLLLALLGCWFARAVR